MVSTSRLGPQQPTDGAAAETFRRRREQTVCVVRDTLDLLDELIGDAERLQQELAARTWDLSRTDGIDLADATAARAAVVTARATLGADHRERMAGRLRRSLLFHDEGATDG
jgi:hypothetical protein